MIENILRIAKKFIPRKIFRFFQPAYHYLMALAGAIYYGFPAKKLYIVGVTGTKGKSSVSEIMNSILEEAGYKTVVSDTIRFKVDKDSRPNKYKMSLPGRFFIQKLLAEAVQKGCTHAVVEITSEATIQFRNKFVYLDAFIFTNLAKEHVESHGSYENYVNAKVSITKSLAGPKKNTIMVINSDDKEAKKFLDRKADKKITYKIDEIKPLTLSNKGIQMRYGNCTIFSPLQGEFNAYNILACAKLASAMGIKEEIIKSAIEKLNEIPGRVQKVKLGQNFDVVVDYAHTPESLEELYKAFPNQKKICVLGNTGGGRDKWKRPVMAGIAEKYCDEIILTNEDPYDEDPLTIIEEMNSAIKNKPVHIILNRREAIHSAISKADTDSAVLITGKGTDPYIMEADGKKTPWSDYAVAKEELSKII